MAAEGGPALVPPEDVRPAQAGLMLSGRVTLGQISATIVDLALRGYLRIEATDAIEATGAQDRPDFELTLTAELVGDLLPYEEILLYVLLMPDDRLLLSEFDAFQATGLDLVRTELVRTVVKRRWMRRWRGMRTTRGEQLHVELQGFRRALRKVELSDHSELLPFVLMFGFRREADEASPAAEYGRFFDRWLEISADFPGWQPRAGEPGFDGIDNSDNKFGGLPHGAVPD